MGFRRESGAGTRSTASGAPLGALRSRAMLTVGRLPLQHRLAAFAAAGPGHGLRLGADALAVALGQDLRLNLHGACHGTAALVRTEGLGPGARATLHGPCSRRGTARGGAGGHRRWGRYPPRPNRSAAARTCRTWVVSWAAK